ncbi:MAG: hypothetical protein AB8I08_22025 [Sandaracinaceae bacterium]
MTRASALITSLLLVLLACDGGDGPMLLDIGQQQLRVDSVFQLTIGIDNPDGRAVTVVVEDPGLPAFGDVTMTVTSPGQAIFEWAPLASQTGTHDITFVLTDGGGTEYDRATALFEVMASEDAAPVFFQPGAGGTYDLERSPCVNFDIEVRDDDSLDVEIGERSELPDGAALINVGPKRAQFDWCPTADQAGTAERWTIQLYADDGEQPRVEHDYIVVLRTPPKEGCPGEDPVIALDGPVEGERVVSGTTFNVEVQVTDDMGLRDAPLLYFTATEPADLDKPDVTQFEQITFEPADATTYVARIPDQGLAEGESRRLWYLVSATDNDDPTGSICDHRVDSALVSFFAEGGMPPDGSLATCGFCSESTECESGICAATASGGRCVPGCSDDPCTAGTCGATVTTDGATRAGCGPTRDVCTDIGGGACTDDGREEDDTASAANTYSAVVSDGQICADDADFFRIAVPMGNAVDVTVDNFVHVEGDLDLELRASDGTTILGTSASVRDTETVSYCNAGAATNLVARVFGYESEQNSYRFTADVRPDPGGCCTDDAGEDDDTRETARSVTFESDGSGGSDALFDGQICSGDSDWIEIPITGPSTISVEVEFTHASGDIDATLHSPTGTQIGSGRTVNDDESITEEVGTSGTYTLRIFGASGVNNAYTTLISVAAASGCSSTASCPGGTVCDGSECVSNTCTGPTCPSNHACVMTGPIPAASQCSFECTTNSNCRSTEACKWLADGRYCGRTGSGANGASCGTFASCGGQRACVSWPGGYCARQGCTSGADCEAGTRCINEGGINVCALSCSTGSCREAEGYECAIRSTLGDGNRLVCVPG